MSKYIYEVIGEYKEHHSDEIDGDTLGYFTTLKKAHAMLDAYFNVTLKWDRMEYWYSVLPAERYHHHRTDKYHAVSIFRRATNRLWT